MGAVIILTLKLYLLAVVISMAVAVAIRGIVMALSRSHPVARPAPIAKPLASDHPGEQDIAAIAAAVYAVMGEHRIVSIRTRTGGWTAGGRLAHHSSHIDSRHPRSR